MRTSAILTCALALCSCGGAADQVNVRKIDSAGGTTITAEVWADNWFSFSLGETLLVEDSLPITTERSFNAEIFSFNADYPLQFNFVLKDFRENDSGLEYIGKSNQQMGDGGFIAQFKNVATGEIVAVTDSAWKCLVTHHAPVDKSCEGEDQPVAGEGTCGFVRLDQPAGWQREDFDDADWINATVYSTSEVDPNHGYDAITWHESARLIWTGDLEQDNTLLCRLTVR